MSQKKTYVGTSVQRAIPDDQLPDAVQTGLLQALIQGSDLVENVQESLVSSIGMRAERMYEYAKSGTYTWGLPSGEFTSTSDAVDDVLAVLNAIEGPAVTLDYLHYGAPNNLHIGWKALIASHGYNPSTNVLGNLTTTKGTTVWLHDMVVVVGQSMYPTRDSFSLQQWGRAAVAGYTPDRALMTEATRDMLEPSPVELLTGGSTEFLRVTYVWDDNPIDFEAPLASGVFTIPITGYDSEASYFQAKYSTGGVIKYWTYEDGIGTYPTLDALYDKAITPNGEFFPFAYFRFQKTSEIEDTSTDAYKTSKHLVKYLGMDYDEVATAIDENPDIDDVENAMLMFAVPANTTNALERRYLFEFFDKLYASNDSTNRYRSRDQSELARITRYALGQDAPGLVIQDTRFKMALYNDGVYKQLVGGSIGAVGTYGSGTRTETMQSKTVDSGTGAETIHTLNIPVHYYQRQITTGFYEEVQVYLLSTVFWVNDTRMVIGDAADSILIVPLDHSITEHYSIPDRELLYARSLHYIFNSLIIVKLDWYQTELFQFVLLAVAIVITVLSWGADGGSAIAAAIAAGNYAFAAQLFLIAILEMLVARVVFRLFVRWLGPEAAIYLAVIAAVLGMTDGLMDGGLVGAPWAKELLAISTGLASGVQANLSDRMDDLLDQSYAFEKYKEEQLKLLEAAQDLLDSNVRLDPFVIFGEKPEDYYNRTVHSGNIGVIGIAAISMYVDNALTLPKLNDSFGGPGYVQPD